MLSGMPVSQPVTFIASIQGMTPDSGTPTAMWSFLMNAITGFALRVILVDPQCGTKVFVSHFTSPFSHPASR
jgi:hypothetical protein